MARPKGIQQKRNEQKYTLPAGVTLKQPQPEIYNKETKLTFCDSEFGEFISTFRAIQQANASTHPEAVKKRREATNLNKYGSPNVSGVAEFRKKAQETMNERYGVRHALQNDLLFKKNKDTLLANHGVNHPMESSSIKEKQKNTLMTNYGVTNPMHSEEIKLELKTNNLVKYGVENPAVLPEVKLKCITSLLKNGSVFTSNGELQIKQWLKTIGIEAESSFIGGANPKQIDLKIKEKNIAIEYNGSFWHSEFNKKMYPRYHLEKTQLANLNGLTLLHIFDFEWENRGNQVRSFLRSKLGKNENFVHARKCEIRTVSKDEASSFLEKWHILGACNFIEAFGLYHGDVLLSVITIGRHHRNNREYVLSRYCTKENYTVSGGVSRLAKHASKKYGKLVTWVDLRWSDGASWVKNGWELEAVLPPDYFYYDSKSNKTVSKQSRQKNLVNTPVNMTEHQHALESGLYRVYDCGKIRLTYKA